MDEVVKCQILLEDLAKSIAQGDNEKALEYYEEYKSIYEKITGKKLQITFKELKQSRTKITMKEETEQKIEFENEIEKER